MFKNSDVNNVNHLLLAVLKLCNQKYVMCVSNLCRKIHHSTDPAFIWDFLVHSKTTDSFLGKYIKNVG